MPVSQPPFDRETDPIENSWKLELTTLVNQLEQQIRDLQRRIDELESGA